MLSLIKDNGSDSEASKEQVTVVSDKDEKSFEDTHVGIDDKGRISHKRIII